jgi:hypothetical protein
MELMKRLTYSKKKKGNFILTTHLHHFNPRRKEILKRIILAAEKLGADFVSPGDLFL